MNKLYNGSIANDIRDDIIQEGYVSFDVQAKKNYISREDMLRFIEDLGQQMANYLVSAGIMSNGNLDSVLMLSLGFPHKTGEIRELCVSYGLEQKFDKIIENLLEMHKGRIVRDGMLDLTSPVISKLVLQNEHNWYNEKNVSESTQNFNINAVAGALGSQVPMKTIENTNRNAFKMLETDLNLEDCIIEVEEDEDDNHEPKF